MEYTIIKDRKLLSQILDSAKYYGYSNAVRRGTRRKGAKYYVVIDDNSIVVTSKHPGKEHQFKKKIDFLRIITNNKINKYRQWKKSTE